MFFTNFKFMRKPAYIGVLLILAIILSPMVVSAQPAGSGTIGGGECSQLTQNGLSGVVNCIIGILNSVMVLLVAGAVVFIAYGAFEMIASEEKRESGKQRIYHGIIGLFVMVSIWGFVNILDKTFSLRGNVISPTPLTSQSSSVPLED